MDAENMREIDTLLSGPGCESVHVGKLLDPMVGAFEAWNDRELRYWTEWSDLEAQRVEQQQKAIDGMEADRKRAAGLGPEGIEAQKNLEALDLKLREIKTSINTKLIEIRQNKQKVEAYRLEMKKYYETIRASAREKCKSN